MDPQSEAAPPQSPPELNIHIDPETLDEIRQYAVHGAMRLRTLTHGGVELGGLLFGVASAEGLSIQTWRPIDCDHSHGPTFLLSEKDLATLRRQLEESTRNPDLKGMHPLGWFVSHTRTANGGLTEGDVALFNSFFPEQWQVTLLLQPFKDSATKAAFYVREPDGTLYTGPSPHEFVLEPLSSSGSPGKVVDRMQVLEPPRTKLPDLPNLSDLKEAEFKPAKTRSKPAKLPDVPRNEPVTTEKPKTANRDPAPPSPNGLLAGRRLWIASFVGLLVLVTCVVLAWKPAQPSRSVGFHVGDAGGQLLLEWDRNAPSIQQAIGGTLDIKDGGSSVQIPLDAARLKEGSLRYSRKSGDQDVVLHIYSANGSPVEESARFVGSPPAAPAPDEATELRKERDDLASQVTRLREQLKTETGRRVKLEEQLRTAQKKPPPAPKTKPKRRRFFF